MMIAPEIFPDTSTDPAPADHSYKSAVWLLGRHPMLVVLAQRIPGVINHDEDGVWIDQLLLGQAIRVHDATAGDCPFECAFGQMSRTEQTRLRLLAYFGPEPIEMTVSQLRGLDAGGRMLLDDWLTAVAAA